MPETSILTKGGFSTRITLFMVEFLKSTYITMSVWKRFTRKAKKWRCITHSHFSMKTIKFTLKNRESLQTIIYMNKNKKCRYQLVVSSVPVLLRSSVVSTRSEIFHTARLSHPLNEAMFCRNFRYSERAGSSKFCLMRISSR